MKHLIQYKVKWIYTDPMIAPWHPDKKKDYHQDVQQCKKCKKLYNIDYEEILLSI